MQGEREVDLVRLDQLLARAEDLEQRAREASAAAQRAREDADRELEEAGLVDLDALPGGLVGLVSIETAALRLDVSRVEVLGLIQARRLPAWTTPDGLVIPDTSLPSPTQD